MMWVIPWEMKEGRITSKQKMYKYDVCFRRLYLNDLDETAANEAMKLKHQINETILKCGKVAYNGIKLL